MTEKAGAALPRPDLVSLAWRYYLEYSKLLFEADSPFEDKHLDLPPALQDVATSLRKALPWGKEPPGGVELPQRMHDLFMGRATGGGTRVLRLESAMDETRSSMLDKVERGLIPLEAFYDPARWGDGCIGEVQALVTHLIGGPLFSPFLTEVLYVPSGSGFTWDIGGRADLLIRVFEEVDEGFVGREDSLVLEGGVSCDMDDPHGEVVRIVEEIQGIGLLLGIFETGAFDPRMLSRYCSVQIIGGGIETPGTTLGSLSGVARLAMGWLTLGSLEPGSDLEAQLVRRGQGGEILERRKKTGAEILTATDERALVLRRAARLFLQAVTSRDLGTSVSSAFMCLESLLLDRTVKDEVTGRLTEAVAYRIGRGPNERRQLREQVKKLYDLRSQYVHSGQVTGVKGLEGEPRALMLAMTNRALHREIDDWQG
jgi:hypothetical protein